MNSVAGKTTLLANVASGRSGAAATARLEQIVQELHLDVEVRPVRGPELAEAVSDLLASGEKQIAVAGGDGTLTTAANQMVGTGATLVPVPIGTLNHFARRLGLERPEAGLKALASGDAKAVPVGILDDRVFLNTATIGLYAELVERREKLRPILLKWPAAAVAFLSLLVRMRRVQVELHVEDEYLRRDTPLVWIGVGWGSFPRVHEAPEQRRSPDLEIVIVNAPTRLSVLVLLIRLIRGLFQGRRPFSDPALEIFHARTLIIHSSHHVGVTVDGEVSFRDPPLFLAMQDDGLLVQVPRESSQ